MSIRGPLAGLVRPAVLPPSARIAILAPSSPADPARIEASAEALRQLGHQVSIAPNVADRFNGYLAGDDDLRVSLFNEAIRSEHVDAMLFARGGYGAMRILDRIDFASLAARPRPVVGFSDVTAILSAVAAMSGVVSFHGPLMSVDFFEGLSPEKERWFWSLMRGDAPLEWSFNTTDVLSPGRVEGIVFGGCLSVLTALIGTPYEYWVNDGIWFWEDVNEPTYRIDRMLTHLRLSGRLNSLRAVMIGSLKGCGSEDPGELDGLLDSFFGGAGIPVIRDLPFGHNGDNLTIPIGVLGQIDTDRLTIRFPEPAVE